MPDEAQPLPNQQPAASGTKKSNVLQRHLRKWVSVSRARKDCSSSFVVDGRERLVAEVRAAARAEIEPQFASAIESATPLERQRLLDELQTAIRRRASELMPHVSLDAQF